MVSRRLFNFVYNNIYVYDCTHVPAPPPFANSLARLRSRSALVGLGGGTGFKAIILRWCVERSLILAPRTDRPAPPPLLAKWLMLRADDKRRPPPPPKLLPKATLPAVALPSSRVIEIALPGDRRDELADPGRLQGVRSRGDRIVGIRSVLRLAAFRSAPLPSPPSKHIPICYTCTNALHHYHHLNLVCFCVKGWAYMYYVIIIVFRPSWTIKNR